MPKEPWTTYTILAILSLISLLTLSGVACYQLFVSGWFHSNSI